MYKIITFFPLMQGIAIKVEKNRAKTQTFAPFLTQYIEKNMKNIKIKIDYFHKYMYYSIRVLEKVLKYYFEIGNKSWFA